MSERQKRLLVKKRHDRWCSWLVLENVPFFRSSFPEIYVRDIIDGTMQPQGEPSIEKETGPTALVNGNNLLGPVSGSVELLSFDYVLMWAEPHYCDKQKSCSVLRAIRDKRF